MGFAGSLRRLWLVFCENDVAELLTRVGLLFAAMIVVNVSFMNWNRFPVATSSIALLLILGSYLFGFFLILLSLIGQARVAKLAFLVPAAVAFAVLTSSLGVA